MKQKDQLTIASAAIIIPTVSASTFEGACFWGVRLLAAWAFRFRIFILPSGRVYLLLTGFLAPRINVIMCSAKNMSSSSFELLR